MSKSGTCAAANCFHNLRLSFNKQEQKLEMLISLWAVSKYYFTVLLRFLHNGLVFSVLRSI